MKTNNNPILPMLVSMMAFAAPAAWSATQEPAVQPGQVVTSLEGTFGVHPGQRRNHIKGDLCGG